MIFMERKQERIQKVLMIYTLTIGYSLNNSITETTELKSLVM